MGKEIRNRKGKKEDNEGDIMKKHYKIVADGKTAPYKLTKKEAKESLKTLKSLARYYGLKTKIIIKKVI